MKALGTYLEFSGVRGIGLHRIIHRRNLLERALTMEIDRPFQRTFGGPTIRSPCLTSHISGINKTTDPSVVGPPTFLVFREINFILAL
jgi:hypothetical protein